MEKTPPSLSSPTETAVPVVLTIAGSDNSAGAGIQADLKAISAAGCYALTALTCVVAEVPGRVFGIQTIQPSLLQAQIDSCFDAFPVAAVKTGMLANKELAAIVASSLASRKKIQDFFLVVDPVMIASCGSPLLDDDAISIYHERLFPIADLVTPNLDELAFLAACPISSLDEMEKAGIALTEKFGVPFLCKGGHLKHREAIDLLITKNGNRSFSSPFLPDAETHGTGCTYSSAIAAWLAKGYPLPDAVDAAKKFITQAILCAHRWGKTRALRT